jgi:hypothetical protein
MMILGSGAVKRSNENRNGFRSPSEKISPRPPPAANGLSPGIVYGRVALWRGLIRMILPRRLFGSCAESSGSPEPPPSPVPK